MKAICICLELWTNSSVFCVDQEKLTRTASHGTKLISLTSVKGWIWYLFNNIKAKYRLHWIWHPVISWCIGEGRKVMFPHEMLCGISHDSSVEFVLTMVSIVPQEWVHDSGIIHLVAIYLACDRKTRMKLRSCRAKLSNSDVRRKKTVYSSMNVV